MAAPYPVTGSERRMLNARKRPCPWRIGEQVILGDQCRHEREGEEAGLPDLVGIVGDEDPQEQCLDQSQQDQLDEDGRSHRPDHGACVAPIAGDGAGRRGGQSKASDLANDRLEQKDEGEVPTVGDA